MLHAIRGASTCSVDTPEEITVVTQELIVAMLTRNDLHHDDVVSVLFTDVYKRQVFNLIPIPPLDGSAIIERFVPRQHLPAYYRMRARALPVVMVLVVLDFLVFHVGKMCIRDSVRSRRHQSGGS